MIQPDYMGSRPLIEQLLYRAHVPESRRAQDVLSELDERAKRHEEYAHQAAMWALMLGDS